MEERLNDARTMIDTFASVGATHLDVTVTSIDAEKISFRRGLSMRDFLRILPLQMQQADRSQQNIIVRPSGASVAFIQCDDIRSINTIQRLACLCLETSANNYQAWIALPRTECDGNIARRVRAVLKADISASGATRVAGTYNFKPKYTPSFPLVRSVIIQPGQLTSRTLLENLVTLNDTQHKNQQAPHRVHRASPSSPRRWPDYRRCVDGAPINSEETGPDYSRADFVWCMTAIDWGWDVPAVSVELMQLSQKAQTNGQRYVDLTVRKAAQAIADRRR